MPDIDIIQTDEADEPLALGGGVNVCFYALQGEYQAWRDDLPDNLAGSALAEALQVICDLDLCEVGRIRVAA